MIAADARHSARLSRKLLAHDGLALLFRGSTVSFVFHCWWGSHKVWVSVVRYEQT